MLCRQDRSSSVPGSLRGPASLRRSREGPATRFQSPAHRLDEETRLDRFRAERLISARRRVTSLGRTDERPSHREVGGRDGRERRGPVLGSRPGVLPDRCARRQVHAANGPRSPSCPRSPGRDGRAGRGAGARGRRPHQDEEEGRGRPRSRRPSATWPTWSATARCMVEGVGLVTGLDNTGGDSPPSYIPQAPDRRDEQGGGRAPRAAAGQPAALDRDRADDDPDGGRSLRPARRPGGGAAGLPHQEPGRRLPARRPGCSG